MNEQRHHTDSASPRSVRQQVEDTIRHMREQADREEASIRPNDAQLVKDILREGAEILRTGANKIEREVLAHLSDDARVENTGK